MIVNYIILIAVYIYIYIYIACMYIYIYIYIYEHKIYIYIYIYFLFDRTGVGTNGVFVAEVPRLPPDERSRENVGRMRQKLWQRV